MRLAERVCNIKASPTLAITAKAKAMMARGFDIVSFAAGEPDFDTPDNIKRAAVRAIEAGFTKYTAVGGIDELKDAIIKKLISDNNLYYKKEEILVSCGGKHSFFNLCQALFEEGDEVLMPAPYWVSYPAMVNLTGARPVILPTDENSGFKISPKVVEERLTDRTRAIVINSPSNPAGAVYTIDELKAISKIAVERDILIISDEIYEKLCYDGIQSNSPASISEKTRNKTILLNGVSKAYSMTGWRIGYAAGPEEIIKAMTDIQSHSTSNPASISQKAAVEALNGPQDKVLEMVSEFEKRRNVLVEGLNSIEGIRCLKPEGAFYVFPDVSGVLNRAFKGEKISSSIRFAEFLLDEAEVAVIPGEAFGMDGHARLSYATSMENIEVGIRRIAEAVKKLN